MLPEQRLADFIAGVASREESAAIENEIIVNPETRREWVEQHRMDAALRAIYDAQTPALEAAILASVQGLSNEAMEKQVLDQTVRKPVFKPDGFSWWNRWWRWGGALACGLTILLIGLSGLLWLHRITEPQRPPLQLPNWLVKEVRQVRWAAGSPNLNVGEVLPRGTLVLESGIVQLQYEFGVVLAIEGPARLELARFNEVELRAGKILAEVSSQAVGFTIKTPCATVVDQGTRFGVWVRDDGSMEAHVFAGKVELAPGSENKPQNRQVLTRGKAMAVSDRGQIQPLSAQEHLFPKFAESIRIWPANCGFDFPRLLRLGGMPADFNFWGGEACKSTGPVRGVRPLAESGMLCFQSPTRSAGKTPSDSAVWQLIDLHSYQHAFGGSDAVIHLSAEFNRIPGGVNACDTFGITLGAFRGEPADAARLWAQRQTTALALAGQEMLTDDDPATWETIETSVLVPLEADYLILEIRAVAPIGGDDPAAVFPGHFSDSVQLRLDAPLRPGSARAPR